MRHTVFCLTGLLLAAAAQAADDGFVPLFDGQTLDGWVVTGDPAGWVIQDGVLHSDSGQHGGWLATADPYANFELKLEYRHSTVGNSGVEIRNAFEVQILAPWTPYRDDLHCTASLYGHVAPQQRPNEEGNRWRTMRILCRNQHIEIDVDGERCTTAELDQVKTLAKASLIGPIMLQDSHSKAGEWVEFRALQVRDLDLDPEFVAANLQSSNPAVRAVAEWAAQKVGTALVPTALKLTGSDDVGLRRTGTQALFRAVTAKVNEPGALGAAQGTLVAALSSGSAPVKRAAAQALGLVGTPFAAQSLGQALADPEVTDTALGALQRLPGLAATAVLLDALGEVAAALRPAVIATLLARGATQAVPALATAAESPDLPTRCAALTALGALGGPQVGGLLGLALEDENSAVREAAAQGLLGLAQQQLAEDPRQAEALFRAVSSQAGGAAARGAALAGLVASGADDRVELVFAALHSPDLARVAHGLVMKLTGPAMVTRVRRLWAEGFDDPVLLLRWMGKHEPEKFLPWIVGAAGEGHSEAVRVAALQLLAQVDPLGQTKRFEEAVLSDGDVRQAGLAGLLAGAEAELGAGHRDQALTGYLHLLDLHASGTTLRSVLASLGALAEVRSHRPLEKLLRAKTSPQETAAALLPVCDALVKADRRDEARGTLEDIARHQPALTARDGALTRLHDLGVDLDLAHDAGFITRWWLIGLFPNVGNAAYEQPFFPETEVELSKAYAQDGKELKWRAHHETKSLEGIVELGDIFKGATNCAAYAYAEVFSEADQDVLLKLGSDDGFELWLNGQRLGGRQLGRMVKVDEDVFPAKLTRGVNKILFKVLNGGSRWAYVLRITDPEGKALVLRQRGE